MKVYHPYVEDLTAEATKDNLDDWLEQGWLKTEPKKSKADENTTPSA